MTQWGRDIDPSFVVVVPTRPGPLEPLATAGRDRDDIDDLLDDMFGDPDERGPGVADGVLVAGGVGALVAGTVAPLPGIVAVGGAVAVALGAVLPIRSGWRRLRGRRRRVERESKLARGVPMRVDHDAVTKFVAAHERLTAAARTVEPSERLRMESVAHAAAYEVASLLAGHRPRSAAEVAFVGARTQALGELTDVLAESGDGDAIARQARLEARLELESQGGSSLTDAAALVEEMRRGPI